MLCAGMVLAGFGLPLCSYLIDTLDIGGKNNLGKQVGFNSAPSGIFLIITTPLVIILSMVGIVQFILYKKGESILLSVFIGMIGWIFIYGLALSN